MKILADFRLETENPNLKATKSNISGEEFKKESLGNKKGF